MPVTGSGEIKLRADVNAEIEGNTTDTNVSLRTLSASAGESVPDALSELYGYSSVSAPSISYSSQSSNYTTITLNVVVNWNGHSSGTYKLDCEVYSSSSLGTNLYETVAVSTASGSAPSGDQNVQFTITPTSQYADADSDYRLKIKATNEIGTTTESGNSGGYRDASVSTATQYTWASADQGSYRGWKYEYNMLSSSSILANSYFKDQVNHPQLGWYTTHQTTSSNNGSSTFTGAVYVSNIDYNSSYSSGTTVADTTTGGNGVRHRNIYPSSVSAGSRPNRRTLMHWKLNGVDLYNGSVNVFGMKHSNHGISEVGTDYNNAYGEIISAPSIMSSPDGTYNMGNSTQSTSNGVQHSLYERTGGSGITGNLEIQVTWS